MSTERGNFWKTLNIHEFVPHQLDVLFVLLNFSEYYFESFKKYKVSVHSILSNNVSSLITVFSQ